MVDGLGVYSCIQTTCLPEPGVKKINSSFESQSLALAHICQSLWCFYISTNSSTFPPLNVGAYFSSSCTWIGLTDSLLTNRTCKRDLLAVLGYQRPCCFLAELCLSFGPLIVQEASGHRVRTVHSPVKRSPSWGRKACADIQQETRASSPQPCERTILEMGPLVPAKLPFDCGLNLCLSLNPMKDLDPESLGQILSRCISFRKCVR